MSKSPFVEVPPHEEDHSRTHTRAQLKDLEKTIAAAAMDKIRAESDEKVKEVLMQTYLEKLETRIGYVEEWRASIKKSVKYWGGFIIGGIILLSGEMCWRNVIPLIKIEVPDKIHLQVPE